MIPVCMQPHIATGVICLAVAEFPRILQPGVIRLTIAELRMTPLTPAIRFFLLHVPAR